MSSLKRSSISALIIASTLSPLLVFSTPVEPDINLHERHVDVTKASTYMVKREEDGDVMEDATAGTGELSKRYE